jgi:transposase
MFGRKKKDRNALRLVRLMARRSTKVAAVALANKIARIAWAMMARNESYQTPLPQSA